MRSIIAFIIILFLLLIVPSPYYKKTTTCLGNDCTTESSFELGPSLFQLIYSKLHSAN